MTYNRPAQHSTAQHSTAQVENCLFLRVPQRSGSLERFFRVVFLKDEAYREKVMNRDKKEVKEEVCL
ncbi:hypothetical protein [Lactococcus garvieae]|uniref:Uncharacterized protein n=1 Tax=Lactococcus garvieae DCC43 TaxID=1231377 RepID=K2QFF1_9LACT|nr:hypothetical protein [Lactococcus garvieae]EKF52177.1 hypothetical protein C426_0450 [Lactococcus garvieae DCC43]